MPGVLAHIVGAGGGDGWGVLRLWSFDPIVIFAVLIPGILYARGLKHWTNRPPWLPAWRPYFFYAGIFLVFIALSSPIDALADDLLLMHMIQHLILQMIAPPLILVGAPTTPVLKGLPRRLRLGLVRPIVGSSAGRAVYNTLTFPLVAWLMFALTSWSWHFIDGAYEAALRNEGIHILEHLTFVFTAMLLWWTLIDPRPLRSRLAYPFRAVVLVVTLFHTVAIGAAITFRDELLYPFYAGRERLWDITALEDQQAGGATMWVAGVMMVLIALVVTLSIWFDRQEKRSRLAEAALEQASRRETPA